MRNVKDEKLYKLFNDINRHNTKYLHEDKISYDVRIAKEYVRLHKNLENAIQKTYTTGVRTYKDFGVYDTKLKEDQHEEVKEEMKKPNELDVLSNYVKLLMIREKENGKHRL